MRSRRHSPSGRIVLSISLLFLICRGYAGENTLPIIPAPQVLDRLAGNWVFDPSQTGFLIALRNPAEVSPVVEQICSTSTAIFGRAPGLRGEGRHKIWVGIPGVDSAFDARCKAERILLDGHLGSEGYALVVGHRDVVIAGREVAGAFYGLQTLHQLLRASASQSGRIPCVRILDWPDLPLRAVMDDISRGPVPTAHYIKEQIRRLSEMKVNTVSYYIEHVVRTVSHPEFAPPGGAISIGEWKDLAAYAHRYKINLVGNFQSFGHFEKILATPEYAHLGESRSLLSPAFDESYAFLWDIYREMVPAFGASFFQTHCDETFDLGKGASAHLVDSLGKGRVYLGHVLRLREMLARLGVRMMIWGDELLQHPEVIDELPRDVIIGTWTYDTLNSYRSFIEPFTTRGFDVLVTPGVLNSSNVIPNFRQSIGNIDGFIRDGDAFNVLGAITTVWDDGGTALFSRDWYGVAYAADRMWNSDVSERTFDQRFDLALYGDPTRSLSLGIHHLLKEADFAATDGMSEKNLWAPAIPDQGKPLRLNLSDWDAVLRVARQADSIFARGKPRAFVQDLEAMRFTARLFMGAAQLRLGIRDAARAYARAANDSLLPHSQRRELLLSALDLVASRELEFAQLKNWYARLWLSENRLYSLEWAEQFYDSVLFGLHDINIRLRSALLGIENGIPFPSPADVRLAILEIDGWYFKDWLITGPISGDTLEVDYLAAMGGEKLAMPAVTQEFDYAGSRYRWRRLSSRSDAMVDFTQAFARGERATIYAQASLESPEARRVRALVGSGGPIRVFVNGALVFEQKGEDGHTVDQWECALPLVKGKNQLLIKVVGGGDNGWGFSFRLPDSDVRNRKNRYRIVE